MKLKNMLLLSGAAFLSIFALASCDNKNTTITSSEIIEAKSVPQAEINVTNIESNKAHFSFSVDGSNYVIDSRDSYIASSEERTTKYKYTSDYNILLIDMTKYNDAVKHIKGSEAVSIQGYVDRTYNVLNDELITRNSTIKNGELGYTISTIDTYLLTADTQFRDGKEYFIKSGAEYARFEFKVGTEVEKGKYYEKVKNTSFSFDIENLHPENDYAIAIQFYYSTNDKGNTLYNKGLQERIEFTTK